MPTILIGDQQLDLRNYQADPAIGNSMGAYIVQFNAPLSPPLMDLLDNELIREYGPVLADDAILCRMGTDMAKHLRATYKEIYAVAHYKPEWKLFLPRAARAATSRSISPPSPPMNWTWQTVCVTWVEQASTTVHSHARCG